MKADPLVEAAEDIADEEDHAALARLVYAEDTPADRVRLRALVIRAQEIGYPGPPDVLEATAKMTVAALRGVELRPLRSR